MPKKKSVKKAAHRFYQQLDDIEAFLKSTRPTLSDDHLSWVHEYAVLRVYREFKHLVLEAIVGAINNDTHTISATTGIEFPKHLTDEVCEYLVVRDGYLDFRGRDGLIALIRRYVPDGHYLLEAVKHSRYKRTLEQLTALRNLAAHSSAVSKRRAKSTLGLEKIGSAGAWLKTQRRIDDILIRMASFSREVGENAPY